MPANPFIVIGTSQNLASAAGITLPLKNWGPAVLAAVYVVLTSTATVGNRIPTLSVRDPSNNILWGSEAPAVQAASTTGHYSFGAGIQTAIPVAGGFFANISIADQMVLPPNSQLQIFDSANIDVNDTVTTFNVAMSIGG